MVSEQYFDVSCSPDQAFDGFTDRVKIVDWWGDPNVYETVSWTADFEEGGSWRAEFEAPEGARFGAGGMYVFIDRPARLEWTWKADWEPEVEKTIHMSFIPSPAGTKMTVKTEGHQSTEAQSQDEAAWTMIVGWFNRAVSNQGE